MFNYNYVTGTAADDLERCNKLMHYLISVVSKEHPELSFIPKAVQKRADVCHSMTTLDNTPVVQYIAYNKAGNKVFDILPLLNAHYIDDEHDRWCIEGYYHLEDRDICVFYGDDDLDDCVEEILNYLK